ncbi:glycosyltransferase [Pseudogemmatithrix spongiicola]|uniref:Glycosyltransferase n=1 Tax=Pseudogemmatithrix spongiicola TaxID=3062599 RepID=A0AA49Q4W9_9BACT|nr:glycosyltransferase [Gemmatimonadaceae bacterium 'strain 138']WKW15088.1 glycosyltransferase [Gemmatimonadaceae bacterium 'strain 318']
MSARRILFVTHAYPRHAGDGAGSFLHRLALGLQAGGLTVRVLAPSGPKLPPAESLDGVEIRRFRYAPAGMESLAYTGTMAEQVLGSLSGKGALLGMLTAGTMAVRRMIDEFAPDVVHAHWWFPGGLLALGADRDVPLVTTMHGSDVRLARKVKLVHPLFRRVMARSAAVTAVSSWLAGEARAMAPKTAITVAPMPVDTQLFSAEATPRIPGRFLFVGRLNAQKGVRDLLEALSWAPADITLDIVGEGEDEVALKARARELGLDARITWHGAVARDALPAMYRRSQSVVMPSQHEGLGLVAVEAQLSRTPVIAYRSGGLPDVVDPQWGGRLVPAGDVRALADAMAAMHASAGAVGGWGASARSVMLDRFAPGVVAQGYRALYDRAVAARD